MDKQDKKNKDKAKFIRRLSRQENKVIKRGGVHEDKRNKRVKRKRTNDYLNDVEDERGE